MYIDKLEKINEDLKRELKEMQIEVDKADVVISYLVSPYNFKKNYIAKDRMDAKLDTSSIYNLIRSYKEILSSGTFFEAYSNSNKAGKELLLNNLELHSKLEREEKEEENKKDVDIEKLTRDLAKLDNVDLNEEPDKISIYRTRAMRKIEMENKSRIKGLSKNINY